MNIIYLKTLMLHPYYEIILHNCDDPVYPMLSRLIKDYSDSLTAEEESFNVLIYLNSARIAVKMVFEMILVKNQMENFMQKMDYDYICSTNHSCLLYIAQFCKKL